MMKNFYAAAFYTVLGLLSGLFYREFTRSHEWQPTDYTQLSVTHTHLLALGTLVFLAVLALDAIFELSGRKAFTAFFWIYNIGVVLTATMFTVRGIGTINGVAEEEVSKALTGMAGLGHILITVGFVCLFVALGPAVKEKVEQRAKQSA